MKGPMNLFFRRTLGYLLLLFTATVSFAANPSFDSFNTNQFGTSASRIIAVKNGAVLTNTIVQGTFSVTNGASVGSTFTSPVTDGASAVAYNLNSANALSNTKARLVGISNQGTNVFSVGREGGVYVGPGTYADFSSIAQIGFVAESFSDVGAGGSVKNILQYGNLAYDWWAGLTTSITGTTNSDVLVDWSVQSADGWGSEFRFSQSTSFIKIYDSNGVLLLLEPTKSAGATPYLLNTSLSHSSGNLLEVNNNGTNKFVVPWDGAVQVPGSLNAYDLTITNQLTVKGNIKSDTLIVTNNVNFFNNTYVSNFYAFNGVITNANGLTIGGNIAATYAGITNVQTWALSDMTTALTTGTNKNYWYAPAEGMTIKWVRATLATTSSSGVPTFDINEAGTSILSTKITVDVGEWDSLDATPPVISDSAIAGKAKIDFDIDVAGTGAAGAQIQIGFTVP